MHGSVRRAAAIAVLVVFPGVGVLSGCDTIEQKTGIGRQGQIGAAAGAAGGGLIAAIAGANPAWIAASTILGGVAGGGIGEYMSRRDAETHATNNLEALQSLNAGESRQWSDPATNTRGSTTVNTVTSQANGGVCKDFTETITTPERTFSDNGTACKYPGREWQVVQR